jgi:murein DD-endopeptidase MepM/ murein hydrolase activator NlpD
VRAVGDATLSASALAVIRRGGWHVLPLLAAGLLLLLLRGAVSGSAVPSGEAPRLYVEVAEQPIAGRPLDVLVSVDVPATVRVRYADTVIEEIAQVLRLSLLAEAGEWELEIEAEDAAGRVGRDSRRLVAAWPPTPLLELPAAVTLGDPLLLRLTWSDTAASGPTLAVVDAYLELDGERQAGIRRGAEVLALRPVPLQAEPGERTVRGVVHDVSGAVHEVQGTVAIAGTQHPVQELNVQAGVMAVVTNEGRELEARTLADAFAAVGPMPRWDRPFIVPVEGRHTSPFGLPRRYVRGGPVSYHLGTDIAAPTGTPIRATNDGVVRVSGMYPIKGGLVIIDHGFGLSSLYFHQSELAVTAGAVVERGQVIGFVGSTGLSTGPHLHWEMRVDGVPTAPLAWVGRRWPGDELHSAAD